MFGQTISSFTSTKLKMTRAFFHQFYLEEVIKIQENDLQIRRLQKEVKNQKSLLHELGLGGDFEADLSEIFVTNPKINFAKQGSAQKEYMKEKINRIKCDFANKFEKSITEPNSDLNNQISRTHATFLSDIEKTNIDDFPKPYNRFIQNNYRGINHGTDTVLEKMDELDLKNLPKDEVLRDLFAKREIEKILNLKNKELSQLDSGNKFQIDQILENVRISTKERDSHQITELSSNLDSYINNIEELAERETKSFSEFDACSSCVPRIEIPSYFELIEKLSKDPKVEEYLTRKEKNKQELSKLSELVGFLTRRVGKRHLWNSRSTYSI